MAPEAIADAGRMARMLAAVDGVDPDRVCVRGSSMGGFVAIHAAATSAALAGVIADLPGREEHLLRGLREGDLEMRADRRREPTSRRGSASTTSARRSRCWRRSRC